MIIGIQKKNYKEFYRTMKMHILTVFFLSLLLNFMFAMPALAAADKCFPWGSDDSYPDIASIPRPLIQNNLDTSTQYEEAFIAKTLFALHWGRTLLAIDQADVDAAKKVFIDAQISLQTNPNPNISSIAKKIIKEVDKDNDGIITAAEIKDYNPGNADGVSKWTRMADYLALDPNKDGQLTLEELAILARKVFHTVDKNNDCFISGDELMAARYSLVKAVRVDSAP